MSEKGKLIPIFLAIGCAGVVGMELAIMLATLIIEGPSEELGENALMLFAMFFWSILWGALSYKIVSQLRPASTLKQKKQVVVSQLVVISILIALFVLGLIGCLVNQIRIGSIFCAAFIISLLIWAL